MIVAIHQPNFFPWLGYFNKIAKSEVFVFMDDVQYPMTGKGCWVNRVKMVISGQERWVTCPIKRQRSKMLIKDIAMDVGSDWKVKTVRAIEHSYKKAPHFNESWKEIKKMILADECNLSKYNIQTIKLICKLLKITAPRFIIQNGLQTGERSTRLLIEIVKKVKGDTYLCGGGASGYQVDNIFAGDVKLIYQDFNHPVYEQFNTKEFVKGLSIIDCIFNIGAEQARKIVSGEKLGNKYT